MVADLALAAAAYGIANSLGASPKVMLSLFEAGYVESGWQNLDHGDRDSLGYLQQRPSQGWPNPMDVPTATKSYIHKAQAQDKQHPDYTAGQLAQSVQVSAFPDKYDKAEKDAQKLLYQVSNGKWQAPGGGLPDIGGLPGVGNLLDAATTAAGALKTMSTGAVSIGALSLQLMKLALPSNVMRLIAGCVGIAFVFIGISMLGREVRNG